MTRRNIFAWLSSLFLPEPVDTRPVVTVNMRTDAVRRSTIVWPCGAVSYLNTGERRESGTSEDFDRIWR